jgi:predicted aldo/keto reductase-like oxidoreductase
MEAGFSYFDTAYGYMDGKSEMAAKTALVDRYPRERFQLATKLPAWAGANNADEARAMFTTSLQRTGAGYFDFYLLHNLGNDRTQVFEDYDLWNFILEQRAKGFIRHIGFSFHDSAEVLDEILNAHPETEFVQLQINYADWDSSTVQAAKCLAVAKKHSKPVIVMEPVKGGLLASPPAAVAALFDKEVPKASATAWALRYAASVDPLVTVLSGMSTLEQMEENIATMKNFVPLNAAEQSVIKRAQAVLSATPSIPCTACQYCMKDCPEGIAIPGAFRAMNTRLIYDNLDKATGDYAWILKTEGNAASKCIACGQCESVCPQHIPIIDELRRVATTLEK